MDSDKRPALLFLVHRIPYPPNKGDKIRSWNLLLHLAVNHRVFLATFIDDEEDFQHVGEVQRVVEDGNFLYLHRAKAYLKSMVGLIKSEPLSTHFYYDSSMQQWVEDTIVREKIDRVVVYSSVMAQYATALQLCIKQKVVDFVDVDSDKWLQYSKKKRWPLNWIYRREAEKLLEYDRQVASIFDLSLFVSETEATLFKKLAPEVEWKVDSYNNGVDSHYFSPNHDFLNPYSEGDMPLVFTGAMDYWPNIDAVCWFAEYVFPEVRRLFPQAYFVVVGSNPSDEVIRLAKIPGVTVTGRVEDIRPYVHYAALVVAPMRVARGVQNKVIEAMAMEKLVIVSPCALEGIEAVEGVEVCLADGVEQFIAAVKYILSGKYQYSDGNLSVQSARARILSDFDWEKNLSMIDNWLGGKKLQQETPPLSKEAVL